jgi:3-dehydroquinate synthase
MVDASVGGKNGVDLGNLKNQVGVINNPLMVLIDPIYLHTLSKDEFRSGMAEMLKHGLIYDEAYWNLFTNLNQENYLEIKNLDQLIYRSVEIKNEIVTQDPRENGLRKALNFGHTLGHAIESYFLENENKTTLLHGEAIAVGMILESYIAQEKELLSYEDYLIVKKVIDAVYHTVDFDKTDIEHIIELLIHDKKNEYGTIQFALIDGIGKPAINQTADNSLIFKAFDAYKN